MLFDLQKYDFRTWSKSVCCVKCTQLVLFLFRETLPKVHLGPKNSLDPGKICLSNIFWRKKKKRYFLSLPLNLANISSLTACSQKNYDTARGKECLRKLKQTRCARSPVGLPFQATLFMVSLARQSCPSTAHSWELWDPQIVFVDK